MKEASLKNHLTKQNMYWKFWINNFYIQFYNSLMGPMLTAPSHQKPKLSLEDEVKGER